MTLWKTVAYMTSDWLGGFPHTKHNDTFTFLTLYVVPSGFWLLVPALAIASLSKQLAGCGSGKAKSA